MSTDILDKYFLASLPGDNLTKFEDFRDKRSKILTDTSDNSSVLFGGDRVTIGSLQSKLRRQNSTTPYAQILSVLNTAKNSTEDEEYSYLVLALAALAGDEGLPEDVISKIPDSINEDFIKDLKQISIGSNQDGTTLYVKLILSDNRNIFLKLSDATDSIEKISELPSKVSIGSSKKLEDADRKNALKALTRALDYSAKRELAKNSLQGESRAQRGYKGEIGLFGDLKAIFMRVANLVGITGLVQNLQIPRGVLSGLNGFSKENAKNLLSVFTRSKSFSIPSIVLIALYTWLKNWSPEHRFTKVMDAVVGHLLNISSIYGLCLLAINLFSITGPFAIIPLILFFVALAAYVAFQFAPKNISEEEIEAKVEQMEKGNFSKKD